MMSDTAQTHYDILGLAPTAPEDVIKAAYKARVKHLHPDRGGDPAEMAAVNEAFATLSDAAKRAVYDRDLRQAAAADTTEASWSTPPAEGAWGDEPVWTDAGWAEESAEGSPVTEDAPEVLGALGLLSTFCLMGIWVLTLGVAGAVVIAGIAGDSTWAEIGLNVLAVAAAAAATGYAFFRRSGQSSRFPSKFYLVFALILLLFALSELSSDTLMAAVVLIWATLLIVGAETGRLDGARRLSP